MENVCCFHCGGFGEIGALVMLSTGFAEPRMIRCQNCEGTGQFTPAQVATWEESKRRMHLRIAAGLSVREMAARLGVDPIIYPQMEWGREPWPDGSTAAFAALERATPFSST